MTFYLLYQNDKVQSSVKKMAIENSNANSPILHICRNKHEQEKQHTSQNYSFGFLLRGVYGLNGEW